ncbi:MAG: hypothetical protein LWY06_16375 [Firmicutes bacterium]|nr:hypothetical protein [Bacillota bacterium]
MDQILSVLGFDSNLIPSPPEDAGAGLSCFFKEADGTGREENEIITASSMGKIWSGQGLAPVVKNPSESVFQDCRFTWFAGTSETTMHDFIYYIDARNPEKACYFRYQSGFCGEPRTEEVKVAFMVFSELFNKLIHSEDTGEVIFNMNEWIIRKKSKSGYVNMPIEPHNYKV